MTNYNSKHFRFSGSIGFTGIFIFSGNTFRDSEFCSKMLSSNLIDRKLDGGFEGLYSFSKKKKIVKN